MPGRQAALGASDAVSIPSAPDPDLESGPIQPPRQPTEDYRTVVYLMLFRVVLASVLLLCAISLAVTHGEIDGLDRHFARFLFGLLALAYGATLVYALLLPRIEHLVGFAYLQIGADLLLIAVLVHATGGAQSAFTILFMIQVIAVALLPERYGAAYVATASALLVVAVALAGYFKLLPLIPGQTVFPWDISSSDLFFRLVLNVAAIATMGALGLNLSGQTQRAGERLARHQQYAGDLALLHQNTIRCLSSGLVTVTLDGLITSINGAACEILGITQATALGNPLSRRIPGLGRVLEVAGPVGSVRRHEIDAIRPDGSVRNLGISATPLSDHTAEIIGRVIHFQDLTELRRMQVEMERSERLASIGRLASGIAHEIRNPLASISGSVEMLRRSPGADGESRQLVDIAVREVDRLNRLITDLLEYARPRPEEKEPLDLAEIAGEIAKAFEYEKRSTDIQVTVNIEPNVGIEGAASQMRQVLWNLLRNAVEAMPQGGAVQIRVARAELAGRTTTTVLSVSDTGVGIAEEDQDQIFEPFFSKKSGGTGLGLATVARIVEDHKGHIEVTSAPGRGTEFSLRFPHVYPPARTTNPTAS
jgi:two-component system sensor histidine kinase PilS (NtrC family)